MYLQLFKATSRFDNHSRKAVLLALGSCFRSNFLVLIVPSNLIISRDCLHSESSVGCLLSFFFFFFFFLFVNLDFFLYGEWLFVELESLLLLDVEKSSFDELSVNNLSDHSVSSEIVSYSSE